ncbi:MAG: hypothetical protein CBC31_004135 [Verrucomicrobia bacterium TMED71]|nr:MAG: hypothetical protein CBC31_004135 [Verrucomicrobia bacterium TMED71]
MALNEGNIFLARSHAHNRIPYLTLTAIPGSYHTYHASGPRIMITDKLTLERDLNQAEQKTQAITLEERVIKA